MTVSGWGLSGADAGNYSLTPPALTANITALGLTVTGVTANNKAYDGATTATLNLSGAALNGVLSGDTVTLNSAGATGNFADKTVGNGKTVTVSGLTLGGADAGNYSLTQPTASANIAGVPLLVQADNKTRLIGEANPVWTVSYIGFVNGDNSSSLGGSLTFSFTDTNGVSIPTIDTNTPAGTYVIIPSGLTSTDYSITYSNGTLHVNNAFLTVAARPLTKVYGSANPTLSATITGFLNGDTTNVISGSPQLSTSAGVLSPVGVYDIVVALGTLSSTSYGFRLTNGTLTVTPAPLTITVNNATRLYGAANPPLTGTVAGLQNGDNIVATFTTTADVNSPAGYYPIGVSLSGSDATLANYFISTTYGTLTVLPLTPTLAWTNPAPITYGTALSSVQLNAPPSVPGTPVYNPPAGIVLPVGTHTLSLVFSPTDATDYNSLSASVSLVVLPAPLSITASNATRPYGAANPAFTGTITGIQNGDNISASYSSIAGLTSALGTYPIVPAVVSPGNLQTNYQVTLTNGTLTVVQATHTVAWTNPAPITYGDLLGSVQLNATVSVPGTPVYSPPAGTVLPAGTNTLSLAFSPTDATDYNSLTTSVSLVVLPAPLTITASNATRLYGAANPALTVGYAGFVNGEDTNALITLAVAGTTATAASPVGSYPITLSGGSASNYSLTLQAGTLLVTPAPLGIAAASASRPYGQTNPVLTGTITGLLNQDAITATYTTSADTNSTAGTYPITPSVVDPQGRASNYTVTLAGGTLTVTAALLLNPAPETVVVGQGMVLLDSTARVADGGSLNFGGGTLTVAVVTNASVADWLGIQPPGTNSPQLGLAGATVTWAGADLATFDGGAGSNALIFSLTTNATSGPLTALLQQVAFASVDTNGGARVVQVTLAYGNITVAASRPLSLDRPPVAGPADIWVTAAAIITIPIRQLLAFDSSPDGNALSLESYSQSSFAGGQVSSDGTNLIYQPPSLTIPQDVMSYVVGDSKGA